ncbi:DoxX family protein [Carbonactinospora thermoautotrophica]|uniref:DoxX family protein n=1 Tax=Carbonactinospora thermoautotrophica TaxID=1469144 RepID=A0A132MSM6_9ACTN|nr:DoxX family protein [Carbonactinospora thermoautotrophica]KWX00392.1 DoxX family protein [Carbonactinospora thermoautotrophica]KWX01544.1 DoxX family protein [Carbonactinospora thermoautotrophica]KWX10911.1 DoxX family protein [Carbonactinospora thermoautotrophica]
MDALVLIGRVLFALVFLASGLSHLTQSAGMAGYARSKGLPWGRFLVLASGVWIIVGALLVVLGLWSDLGALMLLVFLLPTAFLMHAFWKETDPVARQNEMAHFLKDVSLAGSALALFALFAYEPGLGLTLTGPLFRLGG